MGARGHRDAQRPRQAAGGALEREGRVHLALQFDSVLCGSIESEPVILCVEVVLRDRQVSQGSQCHHKLVSDVLGERERGDSAPCGTDTRHLAALGVDQRPRQLADQGNSAVLPRVSKGLRSICTRTRPARRRRLPWRGQRHRVQSLRADSARVGSAGTTASEDMLYSAYSLQRSMRPSTTKVTCWTPCTEAKEETLAEGRPWV